MAMSMKHGSISFEGHEHEIWEHHLITLLKSKGSFVMGPPTSFLSGRRPSIRRIRCNMLSLVWLNVLFGHPPLFDFGNNWCSKDEAPVRTLKYFEPSIPFVIFLFQWISFLDKKTKNKKTIGLKKNMVRPFQFWRTYNNGKNKNK